MQPNEPGLKGKQDLTGEKNRKILACMGIRYIALDIDGTIFSSEPIILDTYTEAIQEYAEIRGLRISVPDRERILNEIGKPVKMIFANLLPMMPEQEREKISDRVLALLVEKIGEGKGYYYPEVESTIRELHQKGFKLLACSNGRAAYIEAILKYLNVLSLFLPLAVIDYKQRKDKGDILLYYLRQYSLKPEEVLMVGDRHSDWEAARKAGTLFAFCEYGHATPGEIPDQDYLLSMPSDLRAILL